MEAATMTTRTYRGGHRAGAVTLPTRRLRFERGTPVEVTEAEAELLDRDPDWSAAGVDVAGVEATTDGPGFGDLPPFDPTDPGPHVCDPALAGLDKAQLLALADEHEIPVNRRHGVIKLRQVIADAIHTTQGATPGSQEQHP